MTPSRLQAVIGALPQAVRATVLPALETVASLAAAEARALLGTSGRGPSDPGQVPADPSGELAGSIAASRTSEGSILTAQSAHALHLEYGTVHMAARPFLRPAIDATQAEAQTVLAETFARSVNSALGGQ